jgi:hypothetical protein
MRTNNRGVLQAWSQGAAAHSNNSNLTTDGKSLWSYALKIGVTVDGTKIAGDFTSPGGHFASVTTSCHVGGAKTVADDVWHPATFKYTFSEGEIY